jgi:beta-glucosidase
MLWSSIATVAALTALASGQNGDNYSPPSYPSPWARGGNDWADAYEKAQQFVSQLTLLEKINLTTGVGWEGGPCVGNTGSIPRIGFPGLCLQDSPLGVRDSKFPALKHASSGLTSNSGP